MSRSYRKTAARRWIARTIWAALLLAGCDLERHPYTVTLIRPDGAVHKTFTVTSSVSPWLVAHEGTIYIRAEGYADFPVPAGWLAEIAPQGAEAAQ